MSNNRILTQEEFKNFKPHPFIITYIEKCRARLGLDRKDFHILDWGCGRGGWVLWLREAGYDAYGVDIDSKPFQNGAGLFNQKGYLVEKYLYPLDQTVKTPFLSSFFDFVISWQVLEHVKDLFLVILEMKRITKQGGAGFHIYPPHRRIDEGHLFMPLIHWFPKNWFRKFLIRIFVLFGLEPNWWPTKKVCLREKVEAYYSYSINETFYRSYNTITSLFKGQGFQTELIDVCGHDAVHRFTYKYLGLKASSKIIQIWYKNYAEALGLSVVRK